MQNATRRLWEDFATFSTNASDPFDAGLGRSVHANPKKWFVKGMVVNTQGRGDIMAKVEAGKTPRKQFWQNEFAHILLTKSQLISFLLLSKPLLIRVPVRRRNSIEPLLRSAR